MTPKHFEDLKKKAQQFRLDTPQERRNRLKKLLEIKSPEVIWQTKSCDVS